MKKWILPALFCVMSIYGCGDSSKQKMSRDTKYSTFLGCIGPATQRGGKEKALTYCACMSESIAVEFDDKKFSEIEAGMKLGDKSASESLAPILAKCSK